LTGWILKRIFSLAMGFAKIVNGETTVGVGGDKLQPEPAFFRVIESNELVGHGFLPNPIRCISPDR